MLEAYGRMQPPPRSALMMNLGQVLLAQERAGEAEVVLRENAELHRRHCEPDDPRLARPESDLGNALVAPGRYEEAEPLLQESYQTLRRTHGERHDATFNTLRCLIDLCETWRRPDQAAEWRAELEVSSDPAHAKDAPEAQVP